MTDVPDMAVSRGASPLRSPGGLTSALGSQAGFVAITPPVQPQQSAGRKRVFGLVPAQAGSSHPLLLREKPKEQIKPGEISRVRVELRQAKAAQGTTESAYVEASIAKAHDVEARLKAANDAISRVAILQRRLLEIETAPTGRPIQVVMARVHEPVEVGDALADTESPPVYVCLHDGCRGRQWADESSLRAAHPTHMEMQRSQQCHVFALLSEAPADRLDPDGEKIGYIAPVGRDGTTIQHAKAHASEGPAASASDVETLIQHISEQDKRIADLMAMVEQLAGKKKQG